MGALNEAVDIAPERPIRRAVGWRAALAGGALGMGLLAEAAFLLAGTPGLIAGTAGIISTAAMALAAGIWAGVPRVRPRQWSLRGRWVVAGLSTALAGLYAVFLGFFWHYALGAVGRVGALLVLVALPTYSIGLLLPVLLAWGEAALLDDADQADDTERWGPLGGVILGLLIGMVAGTLVTAVLLLPYLHSGTVLLIASVLLVVPVLFPLTSGREFTERVLYETETPYSSVNVTEVNFPGERQAERRLYLNGEEESGELVRSGAPTLPYIAAAEQWLGEEAPSGGAYLFLGGGAHTLPRRIAERDATARITVVELDPEITRIAYAFFGLRPEHGVRTMHGDARAFLERTGGMGALDRIYVDVFAGNEEPPYSLITHEAFTVLRGLLGPGGMAAVNVIGSLGGPQAVRLWSVVRTFGEVFPSIALYPHLGPHYPERQNLLLAGAAADDVSFPARAGLFELWARDEWPTDAGAIIYRDLHASAPAVRT